MPPEIQAWTPGAANGASKGLKWAARACASQHVDVDPGRDHVLVASGQDADPLAVEHLCGVAGRSLQEGVPLLLRLLDVPPDTHTVLTTVPGLPVQSMNGQGRG